MIRWFANNGIAANFLMLGILLAGLHAAFYRVPLEVTPSLSWNVVYMDMPYRGGTAKDVERGVLIPIEEALEGVSGIKMIHSDGSRGFARIHVEAEDGVDLRVLLDDVKARVDAISTFPSEVERPTIKVPQSTNHIQVITVAVTGDLEAHELRKVARRVQEDLLELDGISLVRLQGEQRSEISIEANMEKLQSYNLGFRELADAIRRSSIDLPAGSIDSQSGSLVVRTRGQAYSIEDFEKITVRASNGSEVQLGEIATVLDGFEEGGKVVEFNGKPALFVEIMRTGQESAIAISNKVNEYCDNATERFPQGINLYTWNDTSLSIRGRLGTLISSLLQGSLLVLIVLGLFLRPQIALWVVIGIPISFAGGVLMMPFFGVSANVMSLFGYIIVLGVVVDDAIITGENIYTKLKTGMNPLEAAIVGAQEVAVPVTFGALTTIVAFLPLLYFDGRWGDFAKQIPPIVAPVLIFSLIESKLVLPSHLKHLKTGRTELNLFARFQKKIADGLEAFVEKVYQPTLRFAVHHRGMVLACFIAMALLMAGYCKGGRIGFQSFPTIDTLRINASIRMPSSTSIETTGKYVDRIEAATEQLKKDFIDPGSGESLIRNVATAKGSYALEGRYIKSHGVALVEVLAPSLRSEPGPRNSEISKRWTELVGEIPEADSFVIRSEQTQKKGEGQEDEPMELELRGVATEEKNAIAEKIKSLLQSYAGVRHAWAQINYGQDELEFTLKPRAYELGLTQASLASQIRQAFYGEEAQRIMRGVDDIRVMVRLPREARRSLHTLDRMKVRTPSGAEVPLATVSNVAFAKAPSFVERNGGAEVIRIGAMPDDENVDIMGIAREITPRLQELVNEGEDLSFQWTGYIAESEESKRRTIIGGIALCFILYSLLAIPFKSIVQPFFVMLALPFGIIGALLGHIFMDITPSYLSIFGMLALAGVVVNDSLVMVDYINNRLKEGLSLREACLEAGARRFRPIMLTSVTTFVGLMPLLMERSLQAQFLIPMAVSLGFGVLFATGITLYLIPCSLLLAEDLGKPFRRFWNWYRGTPAPTS
ncbi:MAG: multidrug efflux pump subunit AcrB [Verrucomicrobiales bacterium]|jgi:multidrug efflux pump subunit AcrB